MVKGDSVMKTIDFLEKLATRVHYDNGIQELFAEQSSAVRDAYISNSMQKLKRTLSSCHYFADAEQVVFYPN